jgi:hypothetical protein
VSSGIRARSLLLIGLVGSLPRAWAADAGPPSHSRAKSLSPEVILRHAAERALHEIENPTDAQLFLIELSIDGAWILKPLWFTSGSGVPASCPGWDECVTCGAGAVQSCKNLATECKLTEGITAAWDNGDGTITVACGVQKPPEKTPRRRSRGSMRAAGRRPVPLAQASGQPASVVTLVLTGLSDWFEAHGSDVVIEERWETTPNSEGNGNLPAQ